MKNIYSTILLAKDDEDAQSTLRRFPNLVAKNQCYTESDAHKLEGLRVRRVYVTKAVDTSSDIVNMLWRNLLAGDPLIADVCPIVLAEPLEVYSRWRRT